MAALYTGSAQRVRQLTYLWQVLGEGTAQEPRWLHKRYGLQSYFLRDLPLISCRCSLQPTDTFIPRALCCDFPGQQEATPELLKFPCPCLWARSWVALIPSRQSWSHPEGLGGQMAAWHRSLRGGRSPGFRDLSHLRATHPHLELLTSGQDNLSLFYGGFQAGGVSPHQFRPWTPVEAASPAS